MNIDLKFLNVEQEQFYWSRARNNEFDGAFQNGKTYVGCERAFTHLMTFPNYVMSICRQEYKALRQTTMKTFFKICPDPLIHRHDETNGFTIFLNKSIVYWMHLDAYDEADLRGLEINSALIDQAEDIVEPVYNVLDARIGRWDKAQVPDHLLIELLNEWDKESYLKMIRDGKPADAIKKFLYLNTKWPRHPKRGHFLVPNYMDVLCNVADDEEFHWTYRYYNPDSSEKKPDHFYIHREMDQDLGDPRSYQQMLLRDDEWVNKYVKGKRGTSGAQIHTLTNLSIIDPANYLTPEGKLNEVFESFIALLKSRGALYRILDHAETGTSSCGWLAILGGMHIFYREYYGERKLISEMRKTLSEMTFGEDYFDNIADPQIFKKTQQNISGSKSGFWSVAMEYSDTDAIDSPPISWSPADNNEFATRNRINELLKPNPKYRHPLLKNDNGAPLSPAPGIYFIKKHPLYSYGIFEGINQLKAQRRLLLGEDNGKKIYSEERDERIADHAYDYIRYGVAMHNTNKTIPKKKPKRFTFEYYNQVLRNRPRLQSGSTS